ncbi:MAG: endonuclease III [Candidatus Obscuribacterales bacterium]|jgi:endonuclease-3|nr:endonuclease III [Candidatus Obscuribacterales bacterium]
MAKKNTNDKASKTSPPSKPAKSKKAVSAKPTVVKPAIEKPGSVMQAVSKRSAPKVTSTLKTKEERKSELDEKPSRAKSANPTTKTVKKISAKSGKSVDKNGAEEKLHKSVKLVSKATAGEMMRLLCKRYPDAECELTYKNDFELLISVILSAQTTDVQVNKVTPKLFEKFPTARSLAEADIEEVKEIIKPTGYYNNKAKTIQACAQSLVNNFGSKVPNNLEELVTLPGVGRKTANVVLGVIHKIPGWAVDTHVQRLSKRLGLTNNEDPLKIEVDLQKLYPDQDWSLYGITLIFHGRRLCYARNPDCADCPINHLCPSSLV